MEVLGLGFKDDLGRSTETITDGFGLGNGKVTISVVETSSGVEIVGVDTSVASKDDGASDIFDVIVMATVSLFPAEDENGRDVFVGVVQSRTLILTVESAKSRIVYFKTTLIF